MGREERMSMGSRSSSSFGGDESIFGDITDGSGGREDKIHVFVRLRPFRAKELTRSSISDWECINNTTLIFKGHMPDRSLFPSAYTFDRVFGSDSATKHVYEDGAKEIALSVLSGINSSIFAYGQTSSGKTYTMNGITEYAIADIFEYVAQHKEREFVLKFSAMEIYNESVRDLLSTDSTPLRLLDDPERGTTVDRLTEVTLVDWNHLKELLSMCEAQRQIGETSMNESSSRSHQILRLTVESFACEYSGVGSLSTLTATVNFVDLAGSERASQAMTSGSRLKEGSHINRSLLTLGTVIRKLSKGRNGHIPYRESKLTRILHNSLGGNARTAIICTMSPARIHVEQSRNTLTFASCAKEVTTNAQVNVLMSDKELVKQLQKELAKLESQLKSGPSSVNGHSSAALLKEKELLIEQMEKEIKELTCQRDLAQSHVENMLKSTRDENSEVNNPVCLDTACATVNDTKEVNSPSKQFLQIPESPEDNFLLDNSTPKFLGLDPCQGWDDIAQRNNDASEDTCREVQCIETEESRMNRNNEAYVLLSGSEKQAEKLDHHPQDALKRKIQELQEAISLLKQSHSSPETGVYDSDGLSWIRSRSKRSVLVTIPSALWPEKEENENSMALNVPEEDVPEKGGYEQKVLELEDDAKIEGRIATDIQDSPDAGSMAEEIIKEVDLDADETTSVLDFDPGANKTSKRRSHKRIAPVPERSMVRFDSGLSIREGGIEKAYGAGEHHTSWPLKFERYRRKIIELWARCNMPLVHRSYFFLLFKGDPSDIMYLEVELRRLCFIKDTCYREANTIIDNQTISPALSLKTLNRERELLARQLQKKFSRKERGELYQRWGINMESKQRRLQLARRLWTDTRDMKHVKESAALVARLDGFVEPRHAPKELFGLCFFIPSLSHRSFSWRDNVPAALSLL